MRGVQVGILKILHLPFKPLVNDSGWNSTTQYVMVYLFADDDSSTTYNVGNLGNFTWG